MQGSETGKGHFRPRLEAALWQRHQRQRPQRVASLSQRLCLLLPWGWRQSHLHHNAARAWQVACDSAMTPLSNMLRYEISTMQKGDLLLCKGRVADAMTVDMPSCTMHKTNK